MLGLMLLIISPGFARQRFHVLGGSLRMRMYPTALILMSGPTSSDKFHGNGFFAFLSRYMRLPMAS